MGPTIYITGASGTGTSTLGRALADQLGCVHLDVDDAFWMPTDPPFTTRRPIDQRLLYLRTRMKQTGWVMSGALEKWGDEIVKSVDLILFLTVPTSDRIARLKAREAKLFGARILAGGDMDVIHQGFLAWAAQYDDAAFSGRNRAFHVEWLGQQHRPVLELDGTDPIPQLVQQVMAHPAIDSCSGPTAPLT